MSPLRKCWIIALIVALGNIFGFAQISTNQLNTTIQAAVTAACSLGTGIHVDIPFGATPSDTIAAVSGGCAGSTGAYLEDDRAIPSIFYQWNGTAYVATTSVSNIGTTIDPSVCGNPVIPSWCSGSDMGAWINAAITQLPSELIGFTTTNCGTLSIPVGQWTFSTTINKPLCVTIEGHGSGTRLIYGGTTTAISIGTALVPGTPPLNGGLSSFSITTPDYGGITLPTSGAIGIYLGGVPPDETAYGQYQDINNVEVGGFNYGVVMGNNAFYETFTNVQIEGNNIGVTEPGTYDAGEQIRFYSGLMANLGPAFQDANFENKLFGVAIDFNNFDYSTGIGSTEIINAAITCYGCHFEIGNGQFYSGATSFSAYDSVFFIDGPGYPQDWLFEMTSAGQFTLSNCDIYTQSLASELISYNSTSAGPDSFLVLSDLSGNDNNAVASLLQSGFVPFTGYVARNVSPFPPWNDYAGHPQTFGNGITIDNGNYASMITFQVNSGG